MDGTPFQIPLFNHRFRVIGFILILLSLIFGYLYFLGGRPAIFEIPVFAIVSSYMESRFLVFARTNILDELCAILMISGMLMVALSKERKEEDEYFRLRVKALIYAVYSTAVLWIVIFLFVFGWVIFTVSSVIFLVFLINYSLIFRFLIFKMKRGAKEDQPGTIV